MIMNVVQQVLYVMILILLSIPLGNYIYKVMNGDKVFLTGLLKPVEKGFYRLMGIKGEEEMSGGKYALSVLFFSLAGLILLFLLLMFQGYLPYNPEGMKGMSPDLAFNTAISFVTNTNWQAYSGEAALSYLSQFVGLTVQNFLSAGVGIAVLFAFIRGLVRREKKTIGNFWTDLIRTVLYVLIPLSFILAIILVSQGVVQNFSPYKEVTTLQDGAVQVLPMGPAASQIAIKQLGTNGGGFFGMNSAYPYENPTALSNLLQLLSILLIPAALCVSFGKGVKDSKQGRVIYLVMGVLFAVALLITTVSEQYTGPDYNGVAVSGNMEGKEAIHGVGMSSLWATATTAASNGSVNAMHDSLTPLGGLMPLFLMQLGEIVFGGAGSGLYGMLAYVLLAVFIAGLMVGRTPEYLGKKVEPFDMKMVCLLILIPPLFSLLGTGVAVLIPEAEAWITNSGAHGFSEILYAFSSMGNNNGSAFGGFTANTPFTNLTGGFIMLLSRFIPLIAVIFLSANMAGKRTVAASEGTLPTNNGMFAGLLIGVILIVTALSFLPALALGPIADYFTTR